MANPPKYEGTNTFINRFNITSYKKLMKMEGDISSLRTIELYQDPSIVSGTYDLSHAKAIHRHLFQDVYDWAGEIRSYDMALNGDKFTSASDIEHYFSTVLHKKITDGNFLIGLDRDQTVERIATFLGLFCQIHPFPDGNGRTQRVFVSLLAKKRGRDIEYSGTAVVLALIPLQASRF
jgi:cell filamentation protein